MSTVRDELMRLGASTAEAVARALEQLHSEVTRGEVTVLGEGGSGPLDGLADEGDLHRAGGPLGSRRHDVVGVEEVDPVGDDAVAAAVVALAGPGGGVGDGDPLDEPVQPPAGAGRDADAVREVVEGHEHLWEYKRRTQRDETEIVPLNSQGWPGKAETKQARSRKTG